jgi:hypothetical protein
MVPVFCPVKVESGPEMKVAKAFNLFQFTSLKNVHLYFCGESAYRSRREQKGRKGEEKRNGEE